MDNITHTLIGLVAGEAVTTHTEADPRGLPPTIRRTALVFVAAIGSNLPDIDLLFSFRGDGNDTLRYALWHRGYTHTALGCAVLAILLYGSVEAWCRWKRLRLSARDRVLLAATAVFTIALHLTMDYFNSYGVHPFWPADNRWFYGDSIFIVEPFFWAAAAPLFFSLRSRLSRLLFGAALTLAVLVGGASGLLTLSIAAVLAIATALLLLVGARSSRRGAARASVAATLFVTLLFVAAGAAAARQAALISRANFAGDRLIDHVLTPMPANPLCWDVLLLETRGDRYLVRHGILALAPALLPASACPNPMPSAHSAPLAPVNARDSDSIKWLGEFAMSRVLLAGLISRHCDAAAFMLFARAPFVAMRPRNLLGDLRFDRGTGGGFEVGVGATNPESHCRRAAPWDAPRADLTPD